MNGMRLFLVLIAGPLQPHLSGRRWIPVLFLGVLLVATLAACGGDSSSDGNGQSVAEPTAAVQSTQGDTRPFSSSNIRPEPAEQAGSQVESTHAQGSSGSVISSPATEIQATEEAVSSNAGLVQDEREVKFASISTGFDHTCRVQRDGGVSCWGADYDGKSTPPAGEFASVSAGSGHTCGVRTDRTVVCWGADRDGQATPPAGEFTSVSAGGGHTCGVRTNNTVACWGSGADGKSTPPAGEFSSVSAGGTHNCGVRTNGTVACWGEQARGVTATASSRHEIRGRPC